LELRSEIFKAINRAMVKRSKSNFKQIRFLANVALLLFVSLPLSKIGMDQNQYIISLVSLCKAGLKAIYG